MKILLGGIPLGCDNIGDEAIIACVVKMLKESIPGVELTVATADPSTAGRLGVSVAPLYGFTREYPIHNSRSSLSTLHSSLSTAFSRYDAYVWCGATGLSDYPHVGLGLLEIAQHAGVPTFVWGVGMDYELNPVFFEAHGKRRILLRIFGLVGIYERMLRARLRHRIARVLPRCKGVWVRDPQSASMLASMGFRYAEVTADSAIMFQSHQAPSTKRQAPTLGLCISTQRQVTDLQGVNGMIAAVRASGARILGIPMNPKTDRALLERLGVACIPGTTPEAVSEAAAKCDVVLSSRLHLLILAANVGTPILGIARGSKLANWLVNFGRAVEGSVSDCDWRLVTEHVLSALANRGDWDSVRAAAYEKLTARFEKSRAEFVRMLEACHA